jgi:glycosyltransferase involved in cell wall biosynthesis
VNILYINHYAGSPELGMEYRPFYLAREWVRQGHRVLMLAASHSHVRTRQPEMHGESVSDETINGIAYRWLATPTYRGNGVGRALNIAAFLRGVWREAGRIATTFKPNAVIASSTYPLDIWVARRIARACQAVLVFEVHDLWPLSPIELSGMSPRHPFALLCAAAEKAAYRDADVVVSMLPKVHAYMAGRGLDLHKLVIVPNGISPEDWQPPPPELRSDVVEVIQQARQAGQTIVGYAGSMGEPNALDTLLDAARLLRDEPIAIVMVGDGHLREHLTGRIAKEQLSRVHWFPPIPKPQIPAFLAAIDIAYIGWQRVPIYRFGIAPNKLMDYMMAGCAVLHSVEAGNDPVAEAGCGLTVPPGDPQAVAAGVRRLSALPAAERRAMGVLGKAHVEAEHAYPVLAARFGAAVQAAGLRAQSHRS